jgi:hypothetical protein
MIIILNHIKICQLFEDFVFCVISYNFVVYAMYNIHHLHVINYFENFEILKHILKIKKI